jgi:hypothetical protein
MQFSVILITAPGQYLPIVVCGLGIPCTPHHIKLNARQLRLGQACSGCGQAKFVIWLPAKDHHVSGVHSKLEW